MIRAQRVAVISRPGLRYAEGPPFDPPHPIHDALWALLRSLGFDDADNPLGELIRPGERVVIKPNLVSSKNLHERIEGSSLQASSTHGSLLRAVLDITLRAVGPKGRVAVVDSPVEGCEIERVAAPLGIYAVIDALRARGQPVSFIDLRSFRVVPRFALDDVRRWGRSFNLGLLWRRDQPGDPRGYATVDLGGDSCFALPGAPRGQRLRFHRSHYQTPVPHHTRGRHEYSVGRTVLDADVIINLPKLKTHKKTGVTLALKSVIGLVNEKYWLPHFTEGDPSAGGDELDRPPGLGERIERKLSRLPLPGGHSLVARAPRTGAPPRVIDGSWEGNDTLWRTIVDLNRILLYADRQGRLGSEPTRRHLCIVDGIIAGEGEGPLGATPVAAGLLVGGFDPALIDWVATEAMGLPPDRITTTAQALAQRLLPSSSLDGLERVLDGPEPVRRFRPPRSWPSLA